MPLSRHTFPAWVTSTGGLKVAAVPAVFTVAMETATVPWYYSPGL